MRLPLFTTPSPLPKLEQEQVRVQLLVQIQVLTVEQIVLNNIYPEALLSFQRPPVLDIPLPAGVEEDVLEQVIVFSWLTAV